jgi:hypothetical protein
MATSGTTSYSVNELDVLKAALGKIGVVEIGRSLEPEDIEVSRRNLNLIIKQWVAQADFAPGLKMWTRRRGWLFLQKSQIEYDLGPSGDECAAETYVATTLTANAALGAGTITVASITGLASAQRIGVLLDSGSMQWTTINGAPSGSTVTLTDTLTGAAASGATVYAYTSKILRPFEIVSAVLRDSDSNDTPMDPQMSIAEYESIPSKSGTGTPARIYFEAKKTNAVAYLDCAPDDLTQVIRFVYLSYVEDSTATTDDVDFPAEWYRALVGQLAMDCALDYGLPVTPAIVEYRNEGLAMARNAYPARSTAYYESDPDSY